jgi:transposase
LYSDHRLCTRRVNSPAVECPADKASFPGFELRNVPIWKGCELSFREEGRTGVTWLLRAKSTLLAADGLENTVIAGRLDLHPGVVSRWRKRFAIEGMAGLADRRRSGRPRKFASSVVAQVKAMACEPPEDRGVPQSRWSAADLAAQAIAEGLAESLSRSTVRRWLDADVLRPWQYRSWIFPRDRYFAVKAARVLDLYQRIWDGGELADDEYVLSSDEKPGIQVLSRVHPGLPPAPWRPGRSEFEYRRGGTVAYLAAYDVHRAHLMGRVEPSTGIAPFTALVDQVMSTEPYASARRVFWVVDNGASHRNWAAAARMSDAYPNAVMVHLPVHASWLNQIEVVFSVIAHKVLTPARTSRTPAPSPPGWPHSRPATTSRPGPLTGSSPATGSMT